MKERPISLNGEEVRAILAGHKTQFRRVVRPQPGVDYDANMTGEFFESIADIDMKIKPDWYEPLRIDKNGEEYPGKPVYGFWSDEQDWPCPFGAPGDRLWVCETHFIDDDEIYYRADGECCDQIPECQCAVVGKPRWKPSIHMPRRMSRITLEVAKVWVERLQDITEEDALKEGASSASIPAGYGAAGNCLLPAYRESFARNWDLVNRPKGAGWHTNPWVWVVEFIRHK